MKPGILLLLVALLVCSALTKVIVYSPKQLRERVVNKKGSDEGFNVSLANFGIIPYGHSLIGRIYYDPENADGCNPFGEFDFSEDPDDNDHPTPIILVDRGNCTFVKKVRNIEHAGGRLGIVMDHQIEDVTNVVMSDDGSGMGISIPSLLIGITDGKILKDFLKEFGGTHYMKKSNSTDIEDDDRPKKTEDQKIVEQAALMVTFEMPHPDQRVEYDIWYSSIDDRALDFITDFQKYDEKLGENVLMTPHFVSVSWENWDEQTLKEDCYGNGAYCAIIHERINLPGREILLEDLRQRCIYTKHSERDRQVFWNYVKDVHENCQGYINSDCSKNSHSKLGLDYKETMDCVSATFSKGMIDDHTQGNKALAEERKYWNEYGAHFYPSIVINNRTYRGSFDPDAVFNSLCAGILHPPSIWDSGSSISKGISGTMIMYIVLALIILNVVLIYCYRRVSQREMKEDMRMHVNSAVSQYFALSQRDRDTR